MSGLLDAALQAEAHIKRANVSADSVRAHNPGNVALVSIAQSLCAIAILLQALVVEEGNLEA